MSGDNPFEVLGLNDPSSGTDAIKKAYREKALQWHPDKHANVRGPDEFVKIQKAYEMLADPSQRKRWAEDLMNRRARRKGPAPSPNSEFWSHRRQPDTHDPKFKDPEHSREAEVRISFEEAYTGCKKRIKAKVKVRCPCRDYSWSSDIDPAGLPGQIAVKEPCSLCGGTWEIEEERNVSVFFPRGSYDGFKTKVLESSLGDMAVKAKIDPPRSSLYGNYEVRRHRSDIYYTFRDEIGVADALSVEKVAIKLPSERIVSVDLSGAKLLARLMPKGLEMPWKYRSSVMLRNIGFPSADRRFPNGNVYILFAIDTSRDRTGAPLSSHDEQGVVASTESVAFLPYEHAGAEDTNSSQQGCVQQ